MSSARSATKKSSPKKATKKPAPKKSAAKKPAAKSKAKAAPVKVSKSKAKAAEAKVNPTVAMCRQLAEIVESHTLSELIVDTKGMTLTLRRGDLHQATTMPMVAHAPMHVPAMPAVAVAEASTATPEAEEADNLHEVTSPFVGTFYRAPNPDSPPYCDVGQKVEKGQVLCIVEAMKLMNEIEADSAGTIEAILVDNSEVVEYGKPLFKIRP